MSNSNQEYIKGFWIGRIADSKILFQIIRHPQEKIEDEIQKHVLKYFKVDEEQTQLEINKTLETITNEGTYYTLVDDKSIIYSTLMYEQYPSNQAQIMLNRIKNELKKMPDYSKQSEKSIQNFAKVYIFEIIEEFSNEEFVQENIKINEQKQCEMEDIQIQIEQNLKMIVTEHSTPSNYSQTTDQKLSLDEDYKQSENTQSDTNSNKEQNQKETQSIEKKQLKNAAFTRSLKIKIVVFIVILAVVLYAVTPLF